MKYIIEAKVKRDTMFSNIRQTMYVGSDYLSSHRDKVTPFTSLDLASKRLLQGDLPINSVIVPVLEETQPQTELQGFSEWLHKNYNNKEVCECDMEQNLMILLSKWIKQYEEER